MASRPAKRLALACAASVSLVAAALLAKADTLQDAGQEAGSIAAQGRRIGQSQLEVESGEALIERQGQAAVTVKAGVHAVQHADKVTLKAGAVATLSLAGGKARLDRGALFKLAKSDVYLTAGRFRLLEKTREKGLVVRTPTAIISIRREFPKYRHEQCVVEASEAMTSVERVLGERDAGAMPDKPADDGLVRADTITGELHAVLPGFRLEVDARGVKSRRLPAAR